MTSDFPYLCFLKIAEKCRKKLINDVMFGDTNLYLALYSNIDSEIHRIHTEIYELQWIESHWNEMLIILEQKDISSSEKQELMTLFARWYKGFISKWNYSGYDASLFEEKIQILQNLILLNTKWEQNVERMKVSFIKSSKTLRILKDKINEVERNV